MYEGSGDQFILPDPTVPREEQVVFPITRLPVEWTVCSWRKVNKPPWVWVSSTTTSSKQEHSVHRS